MKHAVPIQVILLFAVVGCNQGIGTVPVTGSVSFNGELVDLANVGFMREHGEQGPAAIAVTDNEGKFELTTGEHEGAMPGRYMVTVQKDSSAYMEFPDPLPPGITRSGYMRANNMIPQPLLPREFASIMETPLRFEVSENATNHYEIKLEGKAPDRTDAPTAPALP